MLDVHPAPAGEVEQPFTNARRTFETTGAAGHGLSVDTHDRVAAERALLGHRPFLLLPGPSRYDRPDNFRDDVTRPADYHLVADPQVFLSYLILIVQRGHAHGRPTNKYRIEDRKRSCGSSTADVYPDVLEGGDLFLGRELVRDRPSRRLRRETQLVLFRKRVCLDDDAIGLICHVVTVLFGFLHERVDIVDRFQFTACWVCAKTKGAEIAKCFPMGLEFRTPFDQTQLIDPYIEVSLGGCRSALLSDRTGRGVSSICKYGFSRLRLSPVQLVKGVIWHVNLATHLEDGGVVIAKKAQGNRLDGAQVGRDVFAGGSIAPGGSRH